MYGVVNLTMIAMRAEPNDRSEMVNQLLFGEHFELFDQKDQWRKIRTVHDSYEGWIDVKQFTEIKLPEFTKINSSKKFVTTDLVQVAVFEKDQMIPLVLGSSLPCFDGTNCFISQVPYRFEGSARQDALNEKKYIIENAYMFYNAPYLWGGRSPFGVDCSGFTQMVYKLSGISLRRDAHQQAEQGTLLNLVDEAEPGDLAFFENEEGKIIHVGIILGGGNIIHASGRVRIDKVDHHGIFNTSTERYTHSLRMARRIF